MTVGLKVPVGVNKHGGAAEVSGDEYAEQLIKTALNDCDNNHAFDQGLGIGSDIVFSVSDYALRAKIMQRVNDIFRLFEALDLFKLLTDTVKWKEDSSNQELTLEFRYVNLETDEPQVFERPFKIAGG